MNIFDPLISGSLSVSGSAEISGDLTVLGTINATISGTTSNAISASHAANYTLTSSFEEFTSSYTTGSFTGSFIGDGHLLTNIPAAAVVGLNLNQISDGSTVASISQNDGFRVNTDSEFTGSVTISGSIILNGEPVGTGKLNDTQFYSYTSSIDPKISSLETASGSIRTDFNTYTSSNDLTNLTQNGRLDSIESSTSSLNSYSTSTDLRLISIENSTSSLNTFSSSTDLRLNSVEISTGSLNTFSSSVDVRLGLIESSTSSIYLFTSSIDTTIKDKLNGENVVSGSQQIDITGTTGYSTFSSSIATTNLNQENKLSAIENSTSSLNTFSSSISNRVNSLEVASGSIRTDFNSYTSSNDSINTTQNGRLSSLESASSSVRADFNNYTSSNDSTNNTRDGRLNAIEISTGSLNSFTSSIDTTIKNKLNVDGVISGSIQVNISDTTGYSTFSSSISSSIGSLSGSIATTTNNMNISMSSLSASFSSTDNNHEGRLDVIESRYATTGSNIFIGNQTITGSLYISQNLIVQGESSVENITASAVSIGTNTIILNTDSPAVRYAGISVYDSGSTDITASLFYDSLTNNWKFQHSDVGTNDASILIYGPLGVGIDNAPTLDGNYLTKVENNGHGHHITTSSIFDNGSIISLKNNTEITGALVVTGTIKSNTTTLISGSSQVSFNGITDKPTLISGSSQVNHNATTNYDANQHIDHTAVSISAGSGLSGGGTIAANRTISLDTASSTFTTGVKSKLNADGVISGSSQVSFNGISDKPTLVSGSSQISFLSVSGIPSGLVSGSSQITFGSISGVPSGLVSGSSQITYSSISGIPSGIVSGSSQVSYTGLSNIPSGIVSGSAQLTSTFVQKAGDTMTGQLIVGSTGTGNSPTLRINNSSASSFNHSIEAFSANMTAGQTNLIVVGQTGSTKNAGYLGYNWSSSASNSNYVSLGHWGNDNLLRVYGDGTVYMGTVTTGVWNGTAIGDSYISSASNWNTAYNKRISSASLSSSTLTITLADSTTVTASVPTFNQNTSGNAATVTNGLYTTGDQTITGQKTFPSAIANRPILSGGFISAATGDLNADIWGISEDYYPSHATAGNAWGIRWSGDTNDIQFVGGGSNRFIFDLDDGNLTVTGTITASGGNSSNWNTAYGWGNHASAGYLTSVTNISGYANNLYSSDTRTPSPSSHGAYRLNFGFTSFNCNNTSPWADYLHLRSYSDSAGGADNLVVFRKTGGIEMRIYQQSFGSGTAYSDYRRVAMTKATTFSNVSSVTFTHDLLTENLTAQVFDTNGDMFWPTNIRITSTQVILTFSTNRSGRLVVTG